MPCNTFQRKKREIRNRKSDDDVIRAINDSVCEKRKKRVDTKGFSDNGAVLFRVCLLLKATSTMASPNIRHLARLWRSVPLKGLQQGSTLTIRSNLPGPTHVVLKPEWRDNGHADLKQVFSKGSTSKEINLVVQQEEDHMTSMGRMASHVTLLLEEQIPTEQATPVHGDSSKEHVIHHTTVKPTDKVMLDDGTIVPDSDEFSPPPKGTKRVEYPDGVAHVTQVDAAGEHDESGTFLTVQMPEKVNVTCELSQGGTITIAGKVEGDVKLFTADGDMVSRLNRIQSSLQNSNQLTFLSLALVLLIERHQIARPQGGTEIRGCQ